MVKCDRTRQTRDNNSIRLICIASRITKSINTNSEYILLNFFYDNNNDSKAPQCWILRTLPVVWHFTFSWSLWICVRNRTAFERVLNVVILFWKKLCHEYINYLFLCRKAKSLVISCINKFWTKKWIIFCISFPVNLQFDMKIPKRFCIYLTAGLSSIKSR